MTMARRQQGSYIRYFLSRQFSADKPSYRQRVDLSVAAATLQYAIYSAV